MLWTTIFATVLVKGLVKFLVIVGFVLNNLVVSVMDRKVDIKKLFDV